MGARIFTDSEGNKFELVDRNPWAIPEVLAIKPIKAVEKKWYDIIITSWDDQADLFGKSLELTRPTAQKVAEAIEALMEYCAADEGLAPMRNLTDKAIAARAAFQEENDG